MDAGEWTTNGYWMIKTAYLPKCINRISRTTPDNLINAIDSLLKVASNVKIDFINEFKIVINQLVVKTNSQYNQYINPYFVNMFFSLPFKVEFFQEKINHPVYIKKDQEVIGIIMPIRSEQE